MDIGSQPVVPIPPQDQPVVYLGLTKREWFIGQAFAGLLAHPGTVKWSKEKMAWGSIRHADALLAAMDDPDLKEPSS